MAQTPRFKYKNHLSSAEAGKKFGYTHDYIARLAREKKIIATRVGREWFVDGNSLQSFIKKTDDAKKIHAEKVRSERLQERVDLGVRGASLRVLSAQSSRVAVLARTGVVVCLVVILGAFFFSEFNQAPGTGSSSATVSEALKTSAFDVSGLGKTDSQASAEEITALSKEASPEQGENKKDTLVIPGGAQLSNDKTSTSTVTKFKKSISAPYRPLLIPMEPP